MRTKFSICLFYILLIFSMCFLPSAYATPEVSNILNSNLDIKTLDYDLFVNEQSYILDDEVSGNVFALTDDFTMSDTSVINGNLYILSDIITLHSSVNYSDEISKDGSNLISSINSYSSINGSVFAISQEFTLEPGVEINGDLYIISDNITIDKSCSIYGSVFAIGENIAINGKISGSVYATSTNFSMSYFGSISNDLNVDATDIKLNNVIHRNANISCNTLLTSSSFLVYGNLDADVENTVFSGQVSGNATFNSKYLNLKSEENGTSLKCKILGDLNYSSLEELKIPENIVSGEITYSEYLDSSSSSLEVIKNFLIGLLSFIVYVLIICLLIKFVLPNYWNSDTSIKEILISLAIGIIAIIAFFILFIALLFTTFTTTLSFLLLFGYIFLCFIGLPIFTLNIVKVLKSPINTFALLALISALLFLISYLNIPILSVLIMFLALNAGVGSVILKCFKKKV